MTNLPATPSDSDWPEEILEAALPYFNASISVTEPSTPGTRNPETGVISAGTPGAYVITTRPARLQHIRQEVVRADGNGVTVVHTVIAQVEMQSGDGLVTDGLVLNVLDGGRDTSLTEYNFRTISALGSSHAALRTIVAKTEID